MDKIVCVGKNYAAHVLEMGGNVSEKPVLFIKPPSVLRQVENSEIASVALPKNRGAVHYETEIVLMLGEKNQIKAVTLGLDMTLRDQQANLKKAGQPWEIAKVFSNSAIVGPFIPIEEFADFATSEFQMKLDGVPRQKAQSTQMTLSPLNLIQYAASFFPLLPGDLIFTGTPHGVGPVLPGQKADLDWGPINFSVAFE